MALGGSGAEQLVHVAMVVSLILIETPGKPEGVFIFVES